MALHAYQCNGRRAGDAPVLGWGHDRCALTHVISNSRQRPSPWLSRIPGRSVLRCAGCSVLSHPLPRAFLFQRAARIGRCRLYICREPSQRIRQDRTEKPHVVNASVVRGFDAHNQTREAKHGVPYLRAFGAQHDR